MLPISLKRKLSINDDIRVINRNARRRALLVWVAQWVVVAILAVATLYIFGQAINASLIKSDTAYCMKLQEQAKNYSDAGFYITKYDKQMCDYLGVQINAEVK